MPKVQLISYTPEPVKTVAAAAKLCYSSSSIDTLMENLTDEKAESFVEMLSEMGHESPIEHASFTFAIEGVSRSLLAQITRHRIASYSVQSQRYVKEKSFEYVIPHEIEAIPEAKKSFVETMEMLQNSYESLTAILSKKHYETFLESGMDEKTAKRSAEKKAIEDARFVLPNACTTKMIVTMNARSLINFFNQRCCNRAQWEIQELADMMLAEVKKVALPLFKFAGPSCVKGACPEGKMSCGKALEMREKYLNI
ncbi:MAG: FAD-dependent thymidylate synthase [Oscillospiraceae bacterium]